MEENAPEPTDRPPDLKRLFSDLIRFETELCTVVDARLRAEHDLPLSRFEVMQVIDGHPSCRVHDIAGQLSITVGGASKLVDRVVASGHARRRPHPSDGRSSIVELTESGQRVLNGATAAVEDELERRLAGALPARSLLQFSAALTGLRAAARQPPSTERTA